MFMLSAVNAETQRRGGAERAKAISSPAPLAPPRLCVNQKKQISRKGAKAQRDPFAVLRLCVRFQDR
jgi:hypothetical protein